MNNLIAQGSASSATVAIIIVKNNTIIDSIYVTLDIDGSFSHMSSGVNSRPSKLIIVPLVYINCLI